MPYAAAKEDTTLPEPLSHVRVLDLSRIMAGPGQDRCLPTSAPMSSRWNGPALVTIHDPGGPPFLCDADGAATNNSGYFLSVNRGKRSMTVDLDTPEGAIRDLAARSDILLENYKVGTLAKFGLGYEDLRAISPAPDDASVSGFGQDGPRCLAGGIRFHGPGDGRADERHGRGGWILGGGPQKGWGPDCRYHDRHVYGGGGARGSRTQARVARAISSTLRCWTFR